MSVHILQHHLLGNVRITVRAASRSITARWKNGIVCVNVPAGTPRHRLEEILDDMAPRLMAKRPTLAYHEDQTLEFPCFSVTVTTQSIRPDRVLGRASVPHSVVGVGTERDFGDTSTTTGISDVLCRIAAAVAPELLIPRAKELASRVGRQPGGWRISRGHRILGQCSSNGIISLSHVLVFLPLELCDYVIYHELAHLTEMNHSPRFHALLDSYLGGREAELVKKLKGFAWPVLRK